MYLQAAEVAITSTQYASHMDMDITMIISGGEEGYAMHNLLYRIGSVGMYCCIGT